MFCCSASAAPLPVEEEEEHLFSFGCGMYSTTYCTSLVRYANGRRKPDPLNTVEHITIPSPELGKKYTVKVRGIHLGLQYQYFALVISGPFSSESVKETVLSEHPARIRADQSNRSKDQDINNSNGNQQGRAQYVYKSK